MLKDIAAELGVSESQIRKWKNQDKWDRSLKVTLPKGNSNVTNKPGAPKGNKNATGHGAPKGNLNPIKHGAYQNIYAEFLPEDERDTLERMPSGVDLDNEIQLLRLKIANLSNSKRTFFYDMFGNRHEKEISEEDRTEGILACTKQLEKLIRTQEQLLRSDLATQEQQARIDKLKAEVGKLKGEDASQSRVGEFVLATKPIAEDLADIYGGEGE